MFSGDIEMEHWFEIGKVMLNNFMNGYPQAELY